MITITTIVMYTCIFGEIEAEDQYWAISVSMIMSILYGTDNGMCLVTHVLYNILQVTCDSNNVQHNVDCMTNR